MFICALGLWILNCSITAELPLRCHLERRATPEVETRRATEGRISQIAEHPFICKGILVLPRDPNALHLPFGFRLRYASLKMTRGNGVFAALNILASIHNTVVARPINQNLNSTRYPHVAVVV